MIKRSFAAGLAFAAAACAMDPNALPPEVSGHPPEPLDGSPSAVDPDVGHCSGVLSEFKSAWENMLADPGISTHDRQFGSFLVNRAVQSFMEPIDLYLGGVELTNVPGPSKPLHLFLFIDDPASVRDHVIHGWPFDLESKSFASAMGENDDMLKVFAGRTIAVSPEDMGKADGAVLIPLGSYPGCAMRAKLARALDAMANINDGLEIPYRAFGILDRGVNSNSVVYTLLRTMEVSIPPEATRLFAPGFGNDLRRSYAFPPSQERPRSEAGNIEATVRAVQAMERQQSSVVSRLTGTEFDAGELRARLVERYQESPGSIPAPGR